MLISIIVPLAKAPSSICSIPAPKYITPVYVIHAFSNFLIVSGSTTFPALSIAIEAMVSTVYTFPFFLTFSGTYIPPITLLLPTSAAVPETAFNL